MLTLATKTYNDELVSFLKTEIHNISMIYELDRFVRKHVDTILLDIQLYKLVYAFL